MLWVLIRSASAPTTCFRQEIRKILCGYPLLSVAMQDDVNLHNLHMLDGTFSHDAARRTYLNCGEMRKYFIWILQL